MMLEFILNIFFPKRCVGCGREGKYICKDCEIFLSEACPEPVEGVLSVWEYEGLMEKLIHQIKFARQYHIIDELVEKALEKIELNLPEDTYITFVPMHKKKEKERGFNQAELIAQKLGLVLALSKHKPFKVLALLKKIKNNKSQVGLNPKEREENVRGVFSLLKPGFNHEKPGFVLLVDDVYTTGATAKECVKVLRRAGAKNVWVFTLARKMRI